ncbi:competence/damage-inducible protein A [Methylocaldum szegediense]|uniref:CinA-like protein n=1 Tax=Methylocaldum szegediense TaxID=73780 RepID=A0ABN8X6A1_9GAMM|nr:molybdopterin-binding protein [Methylocaldum szegediense]CAI8904116.1 CinA-like protein [Methylocaldum szegediense]
MKRPIAEILSQGDELTTGEITDTNASWLSRELTSLGLDVARHTTVGDRLEDLVGLLREIAERADLCISTGGLGPTCDDLTAEAAAQAFGCPLELDRDALAQVRAYFTRLGRNMPAINEKQALLPRGSERLDNPWGTAPGFALQAGRCRFVFMPGVPGEMKAMFSRWVEPDLRRRFRTVPARLMVLSTVGVGESTLQERLDRIALPPGVKLGFRAGGPENQVKLLFPANFPEAALDDCVTRVAEAIGDAVFAIGGSEERGRDLASVVGRELAVRRSSLYVVETLSGGRMASRCAGEPWFGGALVIPDSAALYRYLGIQPSGYPSPAITAVVHRLREYGSEYALAQIAHFERGRLNDETETVEIHFVLVTPDGVWQQTRTIGGDIERKQITATALSFDSLRRYFLRLSGLRT